MSTQHHSTSCYVKAYKRVANRFGLARWVFVGAYELGGERIPALKQGLHREHMARIRLEIKAQ